MKIRSDVKDLKVRGSLPGLIDLVAIILDNAVKYSPAKSTIDVNSRRTDSFVQISVKDRGPGIAPKDLPYIFDRFYRASPGRAKTDINGYGLGLSIAKRIVQVHDGTISVTSKPEKGSVFIIRLPARHPTSSR